MTLQEHIDNLFGLYGRRNAMYMRGDTRALFLHDGVRHLIKLHRKEVNDKKILAQALASVFSRTCAFADSFINLPIIQSLSAKYPKDHCAYCGQFPCECDPDRKHEIKVFAISDEQMMWDINTWCEHMDRLYGKNNRERGVSFTLHRLMEEIHEAEGAQLIEIHDPNISLSELREILSHEFADIFAWIFTLKSLLDVDLETMLRERYGTHCRRCNKRPCNCGPHYRYRTRSFPGSQVAETKVTEK